MEINNETIKLIKSQVSLYKNQNYFRIFKDIFIDLTMKYLKSDNSNKEIKMKKINKEDKLKSININEYDNSSLWYNVMKNIFINKQIKNYVLQNSSSFVIKNQYNANKKDEEDYCYLFTTKKNNQYTTNNLVYLYLYHLSEIKLCKLKIISKKEKTPLTNIVRIYLGLCAQHIELLKLKTKKDKRKVKSEKLSNKKLITKLTLRDEVIKNENNPKNIIVNNDIKFNNNMKIKYISNLKTSLAQKLLKLKNKYSKEKEKNILENNKNELQNNNTNDKEEEKKNENDDFHDDLINEEFIKSLNNLNKKNKNFSLKILYSSSFTRLFIGETDIDSIRERYLSNLNVKKEEKLGKKNGDSNQSETYLKIFFNRVIQNPKNELPLIEKNMENLLTKFRKNQEIIEKYKRITLKEEKLNKNKKKDFKKIKRMNTVINCENNTKMKINLDFNTDDDNDVNKNFTTYSSYKFKRNETLRTPKRKKDIINNNNDNDIINDYKNKKNRKNMSFNKRGINNILKINKNRNKKSNNILKINIRNNIFQELNKNILLTERNNNSQKSNFKLLFEKKLFKNKNNNNLYNKSLSLNKNLTSKGERRHLYNKMAKCKINNKTKNFFTKNDFYFNKYY